MRVRGFRRNGIVTVKVLNSYETGIVQGEVDHEIKRHSPGF